MLFIDWWSKCPDEKRKRSARPCSHPVLASNACRKPTSISGPLVALASAVTGSASGAPRVGLQSRHGRASAGTSVCLKLAIMEPERKRTNYLKLRVSGGDSSWARSNNLSRKEPSFNLKVVREASKRTKHQINCVTHFRVTPSVFCPARYFLALKKMQSGYFVKSHSLQADWIQ